jgi:myo-inositol-1-phosphate synthase
MTREHEPRVPHIARVQSAGRVGSQVIESIEMNVDCDDPPATGQLVIDQIAADKTAGTRYERGFLRTHQAALLPSTTTT